jgi:hypothetical protein
MSRASQWALPTVRGCGGFAAPHGERRVSYSLTTCLSNPKKLAKNVPKITHLSDASVLRLMLT